MGILAASSASFFESAKEWAEQLAEYDARPFVVARPKGMILKCNESEPARRAGFLDGC